ncbi:MAG: hypothetical protein KAG43_04925 [Candidatus Marithrix sp.]|nr:hypothetical protein [Candidatus Marithrix sp.]
MCRGYEKRKIFSNICPKGRGAGEKYVHDNYAKELKAYQSKKNHLNIVLVVVIDTDLNSIEDRIKSLGKKSQRLDNEKVAIFIPKRNIETWFRYLDKDDYNQEDDYKKEYKNSSTSKFAEKLAKEICSKELPDDAPHSLFHACKELKRLH